MSSGFSFGRNWSKNCALVIVLAQGDRHHPVVVDPQHRLGFDVDDRVQAFDRMRVEIVVLARSQPAERVGDMEPRLVGQVRAAGRPGVDADEAHIRDAALRAGGDEPRIGTRQVLDHHELFELDHRSRTRHEVAGQHPPSRKRDRYAPHSILRIAEQIRAGLARRRAVLHRLGRGFEKLDGFEENAGREIRVTPHDGDDVPEFLCIERLQGMEPGFDVGRRLARGSIENLIHAGFARLAWPRASHPGSG